MEVFLGLARAHGWAAFKSAVAGFSDCTGSNWRAVTYVVPASLSYLHNVSKEQASYWAADTRKRIQVSKARFKFPVMPWQTPQTWAHVESTHKWARTVPSSRLIVFISLQP